MGVEDGEVEVGRGKETEKKERGPPFGKVEMRWRRQGEEAVEGHVEWHIFDQRWCWEERE